METRGIDSIMRTVDKVGKIRELMIDREMTAPYFLSIKVTNTNTKAIGRFAIIDLLYSPFSPSVRDNTLNSIRKYTYHRLIDHGNLYPTRGHYKCIDYSEIHWFNAVRFILFGKRDHKIHLWT